MYSKVYVEITNVCNKNCSFCPGTSRTPHFMSFDNFNAVLCKLKGVTEYVYFHIMGEPLLHPEIFSFFSLCKQKGFKPCLTTNGSLLAENCEGLIKAQPYKINISVHSFEKGSENEYNNYINSCIEFANKASQNGILTVFRLWNNGFDGGKNSLFLDAIKNKFGDNMKMGNRGIRIRDKLHLEYGERFSWPDTSNEISSENIFCYGLKDHFGILCDGTVVPCCLDRNGVINLGNIFESDAETILSSKRALAIRKGFTERRAVEDLCKKCPYALKF